MFVRFGGAASACDKKMVAREEDIEEERIKRSNDSGLKSQNQMRKSNTRVDYEIRE